MKRRQSAFSRGVRRQPFVSADARVSHTLQIRAGDPVGAIINVTREGMSARLAGDMFPISGEIPIKNTSSLVGIGYASELRLTRSGPVLNVSANDTVIENIRFAYNESLKPTALVTRPVEHSGSYSPTDLTPVLVDAAIKITGDNVTVRNCWFDGFDNAIFSSGKNTRVESCQFRGPANSTKSAIYLAGTHGVIRGCYVENTAYGAYITGDYSSVSDSTLLADETAIFVTSDYNRIHGNLCEGASDGFSMVLTNDSNANTITGNVARVGDMYFITPATSNNLYSGNIGTVFIG